MAPKSNFEDDFEFVGRGPKYLDSPFDNDSSPFKDVKEDFSFASKQFGTSDKSNFHSSKVTVKKREVDSIIYIVCYGFSLIQKIVCSALMYFLCYPNP